MGDNWQWSFNDFFSLFDACESVPYDANKGYYGYESAATDQLTDNDVVIVDLMIKVSQSNLPNDEFYIWKNVMKVGEWVDAQDTYDGPWRIKIEPDHANNCCCVTLESDQNLGNLDIDQITAAVTCFTRYAKLLL